MDHSACREKVCALCWCKKGKKAITKANDNDEEDLRKCIPNYDKSNSGYPIGLCDPCRKIVRSQRLEKKRKMEYEDYEPVAIKRALRGNSSSGCDCRICFVAKLNGSDFKIYCREPVVKTCPTCNNVIAKGSDHSPTKCQEQKLLNLTEREQEIVAYRFLKAQDEATVKLSGPSGGNQLQVAVGSQAQASDTPQKQLSLDNFRELRSAKNMSSETTMAVASFIQQGLGRKAVEPGLQKYLPTLKHKVSDFFHMAQPEATRKKGKNVSTEVTTFIFCDSAAFIHWVIDERQIDPDMVEIIVGIDDGQGMLKVRYSYSQISWVGHWPSTLLWSVGGILALHVVVVHGWDTCPPPSCGLWVGH